MSIIPESRQTRYLDAAQAGVRSGKFIRTLDGGVSDPDVSSDTVNNTPPRDGQIASAGDAFASKLDRVRDAFGNPWTAHSVRSGQEMALKASVEGRVRRVAVYITKLGWDSGQVLTRAQLDLHSPLYVRSYAAAIEGSSGDLTASFDLPDRPSGHHVLLLEIDHPDTGDATYQVIDLGYVS
ncbi:lytic polysaccharide monooxygenase [Streptomyces sp. NPDC058301]|uniref:lytic polysaccharide monooxygenase n=1 Tax=Streptomyces sp. NPDC058301 TaxID=3346436 RepID=UPI0036E8D67A